MLLYCFLSWRPGVDAVDWRNGTPGGSGSLPRLRRQSERRNSTIYGLHKQRRTGRQTNAGFGQPRPMAAPLPCREIASTQNGADVKRRQAEIVGTKCMRRVGLSAQRLTHTARRWRQTGSGQRELERETKKRERERWIFTIRMGYYIFVCK